MKKTFFIALLGIGLAECQIAHAQCVASGTYTGVGSNNTATGSIAWSNPLYANGGNPGLYASTGSPLTAFSSANSNYLVINQLGFSIPPTNIVCGIVVTINKMATGLALGWIADNDIRMLNGGVAATGTGANHAQASAWSSTMTSVTYGNSTDAWDSTWTPAQINDPSFGIQISVNLTSILGVAFNGNIQDVTITVYSTSTVLNLSQLDLSVKEMPAANELTWSSSVADNAKTYIDRSADGSTWTTIDSTLTGSEVSTSYTDKTPLRGENFYRLHLSDAYGGNQYSNVVNVDRPDAISLTCFPNPFSDEFVIRSSTAFNTVVIRTITGNVVSQFTNCGSTTLRIPAASLKPGIYFVSIDDKITKMIKE